MSGAMQMLMANSSVVSPIATGKSWSAEAENPSYQLNSNGSGTASLPGLASNWYIPSTVGIGSSYWVQATLTSGTLDYGTTGSRISLASGTSWGATGTTTAVLTLDFYDAASGGSLVGTNTLTLYAVPPPGP